MAKKVNDKAILVKSYTNSIQDAKARIKRHESTIKWEKNQIMLAKSNLRDLEKELKKIKKYGVDHWKKK
tara:strand:- start:4133 stop:4339 length:207 start_codon:yes stop_codon:yes gene_type:complete